MQTLPKIMQLPSLNPLAHGFQTTELSRIQRQLDDRSKNLCQVNYQADVRESTFFDVLQQQNRLTELLEEHQLQNLLPSLTLTTLTGDPLEYS